MSYIYLEKNNMKEKTNSDPKNRPLIIRIIPKTEESVAYNTGFSLTGTENIDYGGYEDIIITPYHLYEAHMYMARSFQHIGMEVWGTQNGKDFFEVLATCLENLRIYNYEGRIIAPVTLRESAAINILYMIDDEREAVEVMFHLIENRNWEDLNLGQVTQTLAELLHINIVIVPQELEVENLGAIEEHIYIGNAANLEQTIFIGNRGHAHFVPLTGNENNQVFQSLLDTVHNIIATMHAIATTQHPVETLQQNTQEEELLTMPVQAQNDQTLYYITDIIYDDLHLYNNILGIDSKKIGINNLEIEELFSSFAIPSITLDEVSLESFSIEQLSSVLGKFYEWFSS